MISTRQIQIFAAITLLIFSAILSYLLLSKNQPESIVKLESIEITTPAPTSLITQIPTKPPNILTTPKIVSSKQASASTPQNLPKTGPEEKILTMALIGVSMATLALLLRKYASEE